MIKYPYFQLYVFKVLVSLTFCTYQHVLAVFSQDDSHLIDSIRCTDSKILGNLGNMTS